MRALVPLHPEALRYRRLVNSLRAKKQKHLHDLAKIIFSKPLYPILVQKGKELGIDIEKMVKGLELVSSGKGKVIFIDDHEMGADKYLKMLLGQRKQLAKILNAARILTQIGGRGVFHADHPHPSSVDANVLHILLRHPLARPDIDPKVYQYTEGKMLAADVLNNFIRLFVDWVKEIHGIEVEMPNPRKFNFVWLAKISSQQRQ